MDIFTRLVKRRTPAHPQKLPANSIANDLAKMEISTIEDKIDELADLFAGLSIVPPDPVDELAIAFGKMSISRVEPVWIGGDDPMEVDDPMDVD